MKVTPIKNEAAYTAALAEIDRLMDAAPDTPRGDRLDVLVTLVEAYERAHWSIDPPDPIDAIKVRMEQRGVSRRELEALLGGRNRVSEVLNRKRPLTIDMIRRLHRGLDIPAESLIKPTVRSTRRRARRTAA
ncbi:MAG TPA: helix-turn-helix domain-containing protein [Candidatus Binatia bacterium]